MSNIENVQMWLPGKKKKKKQIKISGLPLPKYAVISGWTGCQTYFRSFQTKVKPGFSLNNPSKRHFGHRFWAAERLWGKIIWKEDTADKAFFSV